MRVCLCERESESSMNLLIIKYDIDILVNCIDLHIDLVRV